MANVFFKRCDCGVPVAQPHPKAKHVLCAECHQIRADALRAEMVMKEPVIEVSVRPEILDLVERYHHNLIAETSRGADGALDIGLWETVAAHSI